MVEQHVRYRERDRRLRIEESAEGREFAIEQVVYEPVDLPLLGQLVRAVQVRDPVVGELRVLVGVVANKPLATDPDDVGPEFQLRRNPIVDDRPECGSASIISPNEACARSSMRYLISNDRPSNAPR